MYGDKVDLDGLVDYRAEYTSVLKNVMPTGDDGIVSNCPFHDDSKRSFSVDLKTGKWHCFTEDIGGNFVSFWSRLYGVDTKEAYRQILEKYGKASSQEPRPQASGSKALTPYSLKEYALEKKLPEAYLDKAFGCSTQRDRDGITYLKIPYFPEDKEEKTDFRKRYGKKELRWNYRAKTRLYGEWRLPDIRKAGKVVLVEGESDTQTMWYLGFPSLGVPGASNFKQHEAEQLADLDVWIHVEPDRGGETFLAKVTQMLAAAGHAGKVKKFSCSNYGSKDPSDLLIAKGEDAAEILRKAMRTAPEVMLQDPRGQQAAGPSEGGMPVKLRQPDGYGFSMEGLTFYSEKLGEVRFCATPILINKRLIGSDTGEEKIELSYYRDGSWRTASYPRSTIFTSRGVTTLADIGCTVTSENAKKLVGYLAALEAANMDLIGREETTTQLGWAGQGRFLPWIPGGMVLDADPSVRSWLSALSPMGDIKGWAEVMGKHRERDRFRFLLAASFAAPLLEPLGLRGFFAYTWGDSSTGKTAGLKAALSVWGDPDGLMVSFNITKVALERLTTLFCDLPIGIDERQQGGDQRLIEAMVYQVANGQSKARGAKGGGLQSFGTWRTVAIGTGEEPLSTETSQTGVRTRTIELYGGPFTSSEQAAAMHQAVIGCHGTAGPAFIGKLVATKAEWIKERFGKMVDALRKTEGGSDGAHLQSVAVTALADALADWWIFGDGAGADIPARSWDKAVKMGAAILSEQANLSKADVNANATQCIIDWILSNYVYFTDKANGPRYGFVEDGIAYIFPTVLNQMLEKAGYSPRKTRKYLAEKEFVLTTTDSGGKKVYSIQKWYGGKNARYMAFDFTKASGLKLGEETVNLPQNNHQDKLDGFTKESEGDNNPFTKYEQKPLPF